MARHSVSPDARLQAAAGWTARYLRKSGTALRVHLPFHEDLPSWAMDAGADLCVVSVHKMGAGLEQGSVFHLRGDLSDPAHLRSCADLLATTSPNTLIYAAMDGWRRQMVQHGHALLGGRPGAGGRGPGTDQRPARPARARGRAAGRRGIPDLDRLEVLTDVHDLGISGYQAADWLRAHRHPDTGLSDHRRIEL